MTLRELTHSQLLALVGLMEAAAGSDGSVSEGEERKISRVAEELSDEVFRDLVDEATDTFDSQESLKAFLMKVTDREARELIYGIVLDEVMAEPTINGAPSDLLDWLSREWGVAAAVDEETIQTATQP